MITEGRLRRLEAVAARRQPGLTVVLEDIHDPHNAQAVLRTCDAFGIQTVCFVFEKQRYFNPRNVGKSTSSSANKWLDYRIFRSMRECLDALRAEQFELAATALSGRAVSLLEANLAQERLALLVGNEHSGLSGMALEAADLHVRIPMAGMVQSLNLSVSTALFLYEIVRQRKATGTEYAMSQADQHALVARWMGAEKRLSSEIR